jgi:predicted RNase H-like HicB family nuclease
MRQLIGVIFENPDGGFVATFPDLLECVEFGETAEQAAALAVATLPALLRNVEARNKTPIKVSTMAEIVADRQNEGCATFEATVLAFDPRSAAPRVSAPPSAATA